MLLCRLICARCAKLCFTLLGDGELRKLNPCNSPSHHLSFRWHFGQPVIHSFMIHTNRSWRNKHTPRANVKINHLELPIDHRRCPPLVRTLHCNQNKTTKMKNIAREKKKGKYTSSYWHGNDSLPMDRSSSPQRSLTKKSSCSCPTCRWN